MSDGPFFSGGNFSIVDAVFAPVFHYFDAFEMFKDFCVFERTPKVRAWRAQLAQRSSVRGASPPDYNDRLLEFIRGHGSALTNVMITA